MFPCRSGSWNTKTSRRNVFFQLFTTNMRFKHQRTLFSVLNILILGNTCSSHNVVSSIWEKLLNNRSRCGLRIQYVCDFVPVFVCELRGLDICQTYQTLYENATVRQYAVMLVIDKCSLIQYRNVEILCLYLQYV